MRKVGWGVLGTAKISREKVIPALQRSQWCEVRAVASRDLARAQAFAAPLGIAQCYGSYAELFADPAIEVVYNPLPNHEHVAQTLAAARAGKHVLCEKPIALTADEAAALREVADRVTVMEAFMVRFHPQWLRARDLVRSGNLGPVRSLQAWFSYYNVDAANIRNKADIGGGALYDIGCYPIAVARFLFEAEPQRVVSLVDRDATFGTDRCVSALLDFGNGRRMDFTVSTQSVPYQRVQILGEKMRVEVQIPFNPTPAQACTLFLDKGPPLDGSAIERECFDPCDQYTLQGDAFSQAVAEGRALPWGVEDAIRNMRVIDAVFASERQGGWVEVANS